MSKQQSPVFQNYEEAIERLVQITSQLESGDVGLEQSIALYTEGLKIAQVCNEKLTEAETAIKLIVEKNGVTEEVDFEGERGEQ